MDINDSELIYRALLIWANHIETGNVSLSADDAKRSNQPQLVKQLSPEQSHFASRLKDLAGKQLTGATSHSHQATQPGRPGLKIKPAVPSRPRRR